MILAPRPPATPFGTLTPELLDAFTRIVGDAYAVTAALDLEPYSHDETEALAFMPVIALRPDSTAQVSAIMALANAHRIPVTPRGAGTGLSGGALPVHGGIVLATDRLNRIVELDASNFFLTVEPGVVTQTLQEYVEARGLFYPPDPASRGSCMIGGNLAECAGGPRCVKYGVTRDYVFGVEAVLPTGEVCTFGGKRYKDVTGYNVTQLLVGSEGTLAIVTKIILKLLPLPTHKVTLLAPFPDVRSAAETVPAIFHAKITPCALEFMEQAAVQAAERHLGRSFPNSHAPAQLLMEVDGNDEATVARDAERIAEVALEHGAWDVQLADAPSKQREIWDLRRAISIAVKSMSVYKEEDTVVPRDQFPALLEGVRAIVARYGITAICYGHAGDGNLHVNILRMDADERTWTEVLPQAITEIFELCVSLGGTISGEHGIGYSQRPWFHLAFGPDEIALMQRLKRAFDPNGILNPSKIWM